MRGGIRKVDKLNGHVLQSNDWFQLYWMLLNSICPHSAFAHDHEEYDPEAIQDLKISVFHEGVYLSSDQEKFVNELPQIVKQDFVDVLVHDKRHPLKRETLEALRQHFGCGEKKAVNLEPKKTVVAKPTPAKPVVQQKVVAPVTTKPVVKTQAAPVVKPTVKQTPMVVTPHKVVPIGLHKEASYYNKQTFEYANCVFVFKSDDDVCVLFDKPNANGEYELYSGYDESGKGNYTCYKLPRIPSFRKTYTFIKLLYVPISKTLAFDFNIVRCEYSFKSNRFKRGMELNNSRKPRLNFN
jgi:hypothetical protein